MSANVRSTASSSARRQLDLSPLNGHLTSPRRELSPRRGDLSPRRGDMSPRRYTSNMISGLQRTYTGSYQQAINAKKISCDQLTRCTASTAAPTSTTPHQGGKWQVFGAVCLERYPVVSSPPTELENKMAATLADLEFEKSLYSDHEIRHFDDMKLAESRKSDDYIESERDSTRQTANEAEDVWENEFNSFKPAPVLTEEDKSNDLTSLNRLLDRKLLLLVKQKLGDEMHWLLPQKQWREGQTLRQTAEEALTDLCGTSTNAKYMGNAPCAVYKYHYSKRVAQETGNIGAKVFFFKAQTQKNTSISGSSPAVDHVWLKKEHLHDYTQHRYGQHLKRVILDF